MQTESAASCSSLLLSNLPILDFIAISVALAVVILFVLRLHLDYLLFVALGPGGTPSTFLGFLRVKLLSFVALDDPLKPPVAKKNEQIQHGYLSGLPLRKGTRPETRGTAPHRQISQKASKPMVQKLRLALENISVTGEHIVLGVSCFEKHGSALFHRSPSKQSEICHLHNSDGSMHMVLARRDVKIALEAGWVERHPLARGGWFERFVPMEFVIVYAPRDDSEIEVVSQLVRTAAQYIEERQRACQTGDKRRDSGCQS